MTYGISEAANSDGMPQVHEIELKRLGGRFGFAKEVDEVEEAALQTLAPTPGTGHELGHWLVGRGHMQEGLMRPTFDDRDLVEWNFPRLPRPWTAAGAC